MRIKDQLKSRVISVLIVILGAVIALLLYISIDYYRGAGSRLMYEIDLRDMVFPITAFVLSIVFIFLARYIASSYVRESA
ncbi:hypothetical protein J4526_07515 [Desulfurococcaceae archaeon MEX13E-LK6-19]|nr:hypothetical protein J4526_07515 [Desulfurococcaceae archaeon MEX13E-LK6-19]